MMYNECMANHRMSPKAIRNIILVVVTLITLLVVAAVVIYFAAPDLFEEIAGAILPDRGEQTSPDDDTTTDSGTTPDDGGGGTPPTVLAPGDGELQVHFMDVGQGDSILILFPDGKDMLIDCGNKSTGYDFDVTADYLENYLPDGKLDYLMLTHSDEDHVEYMSDILELYEVSNIFMPDILAEPSGTSAAAEELRDEIDALDPEKLAMFDDEDTITTQVYARFFVAALSEPNCEIVLNVDPDEDTNSIVITDGKKQADGSYAAATYMLTFYCPTAEYYATTDLSSAEEKNAVSPVGILEYNDVRIVLTGDSNEINEPIVAKRLGNIDCDVLKVAHHGSESSSLDVFLDAVDCEFAVISCGEGNNHDHPRQEALDRLIEDDMTIYRTDNNGNIVLTVDENGEMKFTLEREADQSVNQVGADTAAAN